MFETLYNNKYQFQCKRLHYRPDTSHFIKACNLKYMFFADKTWIRRGLVDLYVNYNKTSFLGALDYCRSQLNATLVAYPRPTSYLTLHGALNLSRASFWVGGKRCGFYVDLLFSINNT